MPMNLPLRTLIAGIGGFGSAHHSVFAKLEERGTARVVATCDPALERLGAVGELHGFARRSVQTYKDFEAMLAAHSGGMDLGVIASPIQFHAPMHEAFVLRQVACYLEKPPTLDPAEFERMLAVEEQAAFTTNVGFSYIHLQDRLELKRRMMSGEFGRLKRLAFLGLAPRTPAYFQRNQWAGRLTIGGKLLLDSCLGNAMSHFLNNMLFFADQDHLQGWARPAEATAELYRANRIEGTDTIFALVRLDSGIELRLAASHACPQTEQVTEEYIEFEHATVTIRSNDQVTIEHSGQPDETFSITGPSLEDAVQHYISYLKGIHPRPAQTLRECQGFVETNALFYLAGKRIHDFPPNALVQPRPDSVIALPDIEEAARHLVTEGMLPSAVGYPWANNGGQSSLASLSGINRVVELMT